MAKLVYAPICSLDGFVEDASGAFDWAMPDDEVHAFANDLERSIGTALYGRRMWQTMRYWETADDPSPISQGFAEAWRDADKVVFSRTLESVDTARTTLVRDFEPDLVRDLKAGADRDLSVGGAELAGEALRAGLVDELHVIAVPVVIGAGKPALPTDVRLDLALIGTRSFGNGTVCLSYRIRA